LVARFNRAVLAAIEPRHGGGHPPGYADAGRARMIAEVRRTRGPAMDGTATWLLTTLQRALRRAPNDLPAVSTYTIWQAQQQYVLDHVHTLLRAIRGSCGRSHFTCARARRRSTPSCGETPCSPRGGNRRRGIQPGIARKRVEPKHWLGHHRCKVERTFAWLARYRRLTIRYEELVAMHEAFLHLACALFCWNYVLRL
jgi:transposase